MNAHANQPKHIENYRKWLDLGPLTPEEKEEYERRRRNFPAVTGREKRAMIGAAFTVYGPLLLMLVGAFTAAALLLYLFLR